MSAQPGFRRLGVSPYTAADVLPSACGWLEMCRVFQIGKSRFYALEAEHAYRSFELHPAIGPRRYSGDKLMRYLRGEIVDSGYASKLRMAKAQGR